MPADGPNSGRRGPRQQPPSDPRVNQVISALRKPWVEGKVLQIIDGLPTWGDPPGGGGGGGTGASHDWVAMTFQPNASDAGAFGHPSIAIDGDLLFVSGVVALAAGFQNGDVYGWVNATDLPEMSAWVAEFGTRLYSAVVWDLTTLLPAYIKVARIPAGTDRLQFSAVVPDLPGGTPIGGSFPGGLTLNQSHTLRLAEPSRSP